MSDLKVFICKLFTINRLSLQNEHTERTNASAIALGEITTLDHKVGDDAVEHTAFVVQRLSHLSQPFLSSAKGAKVLSCFGNGGAK